MRVFLVIGAVTGKACPLVVTVSRGGSELLRISLEGGQNVWIADASMMPQLTSANANAPSMMSGWKSAEYITEDAA